MKIKILFGLIFFAISYSYGQEEFHKFNTQVVFEVDGNAVSKKMFYESSFKIVDDKTIIWVYHSFQHNDQRFSKYFIQNKEHQNVDGIEVTIYHVIDDQNFLDHLIIKTSGMINGEKKEIFEVWMNVAGPTKSNVKYNFKLRFLNE